MMSTFIQQAAFNLSPGNVEYAEDTYESIQWRVDDPPSKADVEAEAAKLEAEAEATEYQRLRAVEYPPLTDFVDAVYWQEQGDNSKMQAYLAACEAVKEKYPKPDVSPGN